MYDITPAQKFFVGKKVVGVWWSEDRVLFGLADRSSISFRVEGDCCSQSYFYDFHGLNDLIGREITHFESVSLDGPEDGVDSYEVIQCYGYRFTVDHETWGPKSVVFSFRNSSNGYYGGWMDIEDRVDVDGLRFLTADVIGD